MRHCDDNTIKFIPLKNRVVKLNLEFRGSGLTKIQNLEAGLVWNLPNWVTHFAVIWKSRQEIPKSQKSGVTFFLDFASPLLCLNGIVVAPRYLPVLLVSHSFNLICGIIDTEPIISRVIFVFHAMSETTGSADMIQIM